MVALHRDQAGPAVLFAEGVAPGYQHYPKCVDSRPIFESENLAFKWYDIGFESIPVASELHREARNFLEHEIDSGAMASGGNIGFVILHDCGEVIFLLVCTWNGNNELGETAYLKNPDSGGSFRSLRTMANHRPTFCVWEMAAVAHEANAWTRFLHSQRTDVDLRSYLANQLQGRV